MFLISLLFFAMGILNIFFPTVSWYLSHGWQYKDAEPSDISLFMCRLSGIVAIILSIVVFFTY